MTEKTAEQIAEEFKLPTIDAGTIHSVKFLGSIEHLMDDVTETITVANNHESRYGSKWLGSSLNQLIGLVQEKSTRLDHVPDDSAKLEELYDLAVYALMCIHKAREQLKDFKYPQREEKTERDHK